MRPAFGDWRSLVAHFVRDEGVGGSNPLSPTNSEKPAYGLAFCCLEFSIVGLISEAPSGRIGRPLSVTPDGGAGALSGLRLSIVGLRHQAGSVAHFRQRRMAAQAPYPAYGDFTIGKKCASLLTVCSRFCDIFHCLFLSLLKFFFALLMAEPSIFRCAF